MFSKKVIFILVMLIAGVILPAQSEAAVLKKDYGDSKLCSCVETGGGCSVLVSPSGIDCLSGSCCSAYVQNIGKDEDLLNTVKNGFGCGSVSKATWVYGTYTRNFDCHAPSLEKKCLCTNGKENTVTNEMVYSCKVENVMDGDVPKNYQSFEAIPAGCPAEYRVALGTSFCCCKDVGTGSLTQTRECKQITGQKEVSCNKNVFEGVLEQGSSVKDPGYQAFNIVADTGCSSYEKSATEYKGAASGASLGDLKNEAASALNPMKFKTGTAGINDFIGRIVYALTYVMGSLLLLFYVYAGILWMTASGNSERAGKAKQIIVWSTLGVVVVLASYMIVQFVFKTVG